MYNILYNKKQQQQQNNMPSLKYIKNKPHIEKWVENNREKYNQTVYRGIKRYRAYQQQARIFRNILI